MSNPRVSVLIPTFNRANYLPEAISSVLAQTFADFEIVILDDGSTDNTKQVVEAFADPRIRYHYQENRGVSAALNTAWRLSRGEYLGRLDSDDAWQPDLLASLVPVLDKQPKAGVVYTRAQAMDAEGRELPQVFGRAPRFPGKMVKSLLYGDCVCPIAVVFRRECLERVGGYDETIPGTEDWDVWLRIANHWQFEFLDSIQARYRVHQGNITALNSQHFERLLRDRARVLEKFYLNDPSPEALAIKPLAFRNLYQELAIRQLAARRWPGAWHSFRQTMQVAPNPFTAVPRFIFVSFYYMYLRNTGWGEGLVNRFTASRRKRGGK